MPFEKKNEKKIFWSLIFVKVHKYLGLPSLSDHVFISPHREVIYSPSRCTIDSADLPPDRQSPISLRGIYHSHAVIRFRLPLLFRFIFCSTRQKNKKKTKNGIRIPQLPTPPPFHPSPHLTSPLLPPPPPPPPFLPLLLPLSSPPNPATPFPIPKPHQKNKIPIPFSRKPHEPIARRRARHS